jgi:MFS transporter, putative metabolite transport protein
MTMESLTVRSKRDIIDFVNSHPNPKRGSIMVYIALGGIFIDAYDFTSLGIGVDTLTRQLSLTPFQVGSVTAIMALGALIGAFGGGYVTDRLGRFKTFIIDLICLVVAAIGSALAWDLWSLLFFRFLLGVGVGMDFPVALSFIAEFTNSQTKGKYVNLWQAMWYIAAASTGLFTLPLYFIGVGDNLWRWAVGLGAVWALIILILRLIYIDESPMWAAHRQGLREAANILEKNYDVRVTVAPAEEETSETRRRVSLGSIFQKGLRARTTLTSIIASTQSMEYFAVGFYLPSITALLFGGTPQEGALYAILGAIVFNIFGIVGGTTQSFLTHRLGIWRLAFIGYCIAAASLLVVGLTNESIPTYLAALLIGTFIFGHSFGPGSQGMTMATLSYPTQFRGVGSGWGQTMVRVGSILGFYAFPLVLAAVGLAKTLLFLTIVPVIGLIALLLIRWEPIGQDVEEMPESEAVALAAQSGVGPGQASGGEPEPSNVQDREEPT